MDELLREARLTQFIAREGAVVVTAAARTVINRFRDEIADGQFDEESIAHAVSELAANVVKEVGQAIEIFVAHSDQRYRSDLAHEPRKITLVH